MNRLAEAFIIVRSVALRDHHGRAGGQPRAEAYNGIDNRTGGSHCRLRLFADKLAHHQRIHRVVKLLKQKADGHRNREAQQMHPDISLGHVGIHPRHFLPSRFTLCFIGRRIVPRLIPSP